MAWNKNDIFRQLKNILLCIFGNILLAFATSVFFYEFNIITGGISGMSIIFNSLYSFGLDSSTGEIIWTFILTWSFYIIGVVGLGKNFALKTLISTIVVPVFVAIFRKTLLFDGSFLKFAGDITLAHYILASAFGGVLVGVGCGITFLGGGSTGGVDIPSLILQKYAKIRVSYVSFTIDSIIIIMGLFIMKRFDYFLVGIVGAFFASFMMDKVFLGNKNRFIAYIISEKYEEINSFIIEKMDRGATLIDAHGGYSKNEFKMIKVCFELREYAVLKEALNRLDPRAFLSIVKAHEVHGEGFENKVEMFNNTKLDEWLKKNRKGENHERESKV